ncbi:hypothetical protein GCM10010277_60580 [Streptomyces longisporoflavus]|nr:hypothetical protein GCM10010277_60580 [Streptomyces longisporoflavus]
MQTTAYAHRVVLRSGRIVRKRRERVAHYGSCLSPVILPNHSPGVHRVRRLTENQHGAVFPTPSAPVFAAGLKASKSGGSVP